MSLVSCVVLPWLITGRSYSVLQNFPVFWFWLLFFCPSGFILLARLRSSCYESSPIPCTVLAVMMLFVPHWKWRGRKWWCKVPSLQRSPLYPGVELVALSISRVRMKVLRLCLGLSGLGGGDTEMSPGDPTADRMVTDHR